MAPTSTRRSARSAAAAAAEGFQGTTLAQTPANKRANRSEDPGGGGGGGAANASEVKFAVPFTPQGVGKAAGFTTGMMSVGKTPGTVRHPRRGEEMFSKNGSPLGPTAPDDDSDGDDGGGGGGGGTSVSQLLSSVKKVTAIASAMKSGRKKRGGGGGGTSAGGGEGLVGAAEELGYELRELADVDPEAGPETVEQAVGALQLLQGQVAAAMARLMGKK